LLTQVEHGASEPVQLVHGNAVELSERRRLHQRIQGRTTGLGSAESTVDELASDAPTPACDKFSKLF
jgi:hypothetical protein